MQEFFEYLQKCGKIYEPGTMCNSVHCTRKCVKFELKKLELQTDL